MSGTPRTDSEWFWANRMGDDELVVQASFARQLERELNDTKNLLKIADEDYDKLRDYVWFLEREAGEAATQKAREAFNKMKKQ